MSVQKTTPLTHVISSILLMHAKAIVCQFLIVFLKHWDMVKVKRWEFWHKSHFLCLLMTISVNCQDYQRISGLKFWSWHTLETFHRRICCVKLPDRWKFARRPDWRPVSPFALGKQNHAHFLMLHHQTSQLTSYSIFSSLFRFLKVFIPVLSWAWSW